MEDFVPHLLVVVLSRPLLISSNALLGRLADFLDTIELGSHPYLVYHLIEGLYSKVRDFELDGEDGLGTKSHTERGFLGWASPSCSVSP